HTSSTPPTTPTPGAPDPDPDPGAVPDRVVPNHHAHHPGFSGVIGLLGALSMAVGRDAAAQLAARRAGVGPGDRLVDVGCGPGRAARLAARRGATVIAVDPATVMLRTARLLGPRAAVDWR